MNALLRARLVKLKEEAEVLIKIIDDGGLQEMRPVDPGGPSWFRLPSFHVTDFNPESAPDPCFLPLPQTNSE